MALSAKSSGLSAVEATRGKVVGGAQRKGSYYTAPIQLLIQLSI
jgi:hypothetical protein